MKAGILHQLTRTLGRRRASAVRLIGAGFNAIRQLAAADLQRLLRFTYTARQFPDEKSRAL
ncbi:hypothetical protein C6Y58_12665 [Stutzerimonas stutzeri]|uniref:Uncharacterized protein n=1 Tax=Pseudomonas songnenensis TaxID=1176259 RepID=A0ABX9V188_9PSED|nr:hypothetical protein C6Y58_12665 [Stutzerimonas stutzeri]RMH99506.1 hypothetical protein EA798_02175 [Pseudomonas songnenensis]